MRFVCSNKDAFIKAKMAHMFLIRAYEAKQLGSVVNMDEVIESLDPTKLIEQITDMVEDIKKS